MAERFVNDPVQHTFECSFLLPRSIGACLKKTSFSLNKKGRWLNRSSPAATDKTVHVEILSILTARGNPADGIRRMAARYRNRALSGTHFPPP